MIVVSDAAEERFGMAKGMMLCDTSSERACARVCVCVCLRVCDKQGLASSNLLVIAFILRWLISNEQEHCSTDLFVIVLMYMCLRIYVRACVRVCVCVSWCHGFYLQ